MDIILAILGFILLFIGLAGTVLPLPGPPLSFIGIILLQFTHYFNFSETTLYTFGILSLIITILDYYIPIWGTKKFGGSKFGIYGSSIGMLIGLFLGPLGIFIGAFVGAFVGEITYSKNKNIAFKAALGSFIGILTGIIAKIALCVSMIIMAIIELFQYIRNS